LVCTVTVPFGLFTVVSFFTIIITFTSLITFTLISNTYPSFCGFADIVIDLPITATHRFGYHVTGNRFFFNTDSFTLTVSGGFYAIGIRWTIRVLLTARNHKKDYCTKKKCPE
jgi:hypothetical protein